jgi:hypothetical protein
MIWAAVAWYSCGRIITLNGRNTASDYVNSLGSQVHSLVQMLYSNDEAAFQDDGSPMHTARSVQSRFE